MISAIRDFFELNFQLVLFAYGQVFFVLGLAVALQSRRHSRLELARSLRWLAVFGLTHGFHEWGLLLVPIQATYLSQDAVAFLIIVRTALLGISFAALFQFAADLVRDRWSWLVWVPIAITIIWILIIVFDGLVTRPGIGPWQQTASVWARYLIALPASLLAAWGLRYQAERQIRPLQLDYIYNMLRVAGLGLVAYALFSGFIVPYADFFPANFVNQTALVDLVGVPVPVFRSLIGLVLAVTVIRALEVFDVEVDRLIERMEVKQSLASERERIGRELHDGAIQRVYTAGLIIESARGKVEEESIVAQRLDRAMTALNEAIASLRAYMTDLRTEPSPLSLADGLRSQTNDPRLNTLLDINLELNLSESRSLNPAGTTHVLAIVGEALANAARHSQARHVTVRAEDANGGFSVEIVDDGKGFTTTKQATGYGLRNMRDRARLLGGELQIESEPGRGTRIKLIAPWEEM
ncbi:MAG TPA: sensor histidine kinase [Candidatus Sulfomarinibacteraceae bacterium]|nr:sensor histidine kinase [Candidatus Sulfomarinibacteraceae bacterium]